MGTYGKVFMAPCNLTRPAGVQVTLPSSGSLKDAHIQQLLSFHSGAIVGLATSPYSHLAITAGADGTVRLHDYWYVHLSYSRRLRPLPSPHDLHCCA